jgi:hypothetical protein
MAREGSFADQKTENSAPANSTNQSGVSGPLVRQTNFSVPFVGIIKARERRDLLLNSAEITYTIGDRKIRRESVRTAPGRKLAEFGLGSAGIICDLQTDQVVLYRAQFSKKGYVRMTLADYQKLVSTSDLFAGTSALPLLTVKPAVWTYVGTFFVDVPQPIPEGSMTNLPDARTVGGLPCDFLAIQSRDVLFEISHCQRIKADRQMLNLVELRLPAEVTGFPLLMRRLQTVRTTPPNQGASQSQKLLQQGIRWVSDVAEKAMKREFELLEITEKLSSESAFTLDEAFVKCSSIDELHAMFKPPEGHHDDWD